MITARAGMPAVRRVRGMSSAWQWAHTAVLVAAFGLAFAAWRHPSGTVSVPPAEEDRAAAGALWGAVAYRDSVGLGRTPAVVGFQATPGYVRVIVDRGDRAGCAQFGVTLNPGSFGFAGPAAPVACPPLTAAEVIVGRDVLAGSPLHVFAARFAEDWLGGRPVDLYAAAGVTLTPPNPATAVTVGRVTAREGDVTVAATADGTPVALRVAVTDRGGKFEVSAVRGGPAVNVGAAAGTLPTPPVTSTTAKTTTTTTAARSATPQTTTTVPTPPAGAGA